MDKGEPWVLKQLAADKEKICEDGNLIEAWNENELNQRIKNGPWENWWGS